MPHKTLLKNGTALIHDDHDHVQAVKTDILINGNKIEKIGKNITAPDADVIDCTDKLISPGFVDTHHHIWQTQLKGRHANETFINYMPSGNLISVVFQPQDVFWGQLSGCLEMLDGGTTTVADCAHMNAAEEENNFYAVSATVSSGIRSVFGFSPSVKAESFNPTVLNSNSLSEHNMATLEKLAQASPWAGGRVKLGLAWDGFPYTPKEYVDMLMKKVDEYKIDLIQVHVSWKPGKPSAPQAIEKLGVLDSRFLMAHSNMPKEDADLYRKRGVHYSSTPSTEMQMALTFPPIAFRDELGVKDLGSLGVDCHSNNAAYIPSEARIGLQGARAHRGEIAEKEGKMPLTVGHTVEEAFNLATIQGARAMKMSDQIGSIAEGKFADLVIFDGNTPAMVCGAVHDPVAAVILHSSPADIESVIVDGVVRKEKGKLTTVKLDEQGKRIAGADTLRWRDVASRLIQSRERIQTEADKIDFVDAEKKVMELFQIGKDELWEP